VHWCYWCYWCTGAFTFKGLIIGTSWKIGTDPPVTHTHTHTHTHTNTNTCTIPVVVGVGSVIVR
jgi:hypothetical protein